MAGEKFKIVIIGGSVTGLALANALERLDVDYVLLEAHKHVAPQLGASIAMWANGERLLDQLGCLEGFQKDSESLDAGSFIMNGKLLKVWPGFTQQWRKRYGYDFYFNDRKTLLEVLYNKIKDKSRILTNQRVVRLELAKSGVYAHTQNGERFEGDILVGGDGVHSVIRDEMWRIANEISPGYFPEKENKHVPIYYRAVYGISKPHPRSARHRATPAAYKGHSYLSGFGPGGRIYWFLFEKLERPLYYDETPRYTEDDLKELIHKYRDDLVLDHLTLEELYDSRQSAVLTPIHEWVYARWHFGRILTMGDAVHKPHPLTGQGGNGCLEDVAAFVNSLTAKMDAVKGSLSDDDITAVFAEMQTKREARSKKAVEIAHKSQSFQAMQLPAAGFLIPLLMPLMGRDRIGAMLEQGAGLVETAEYFHKLPLPDRPHFVPYVHELPAKPLKDSGLAKWTTRLALLGLFYVASYALKVPKFAPSLSFLGTPFKDIYTGIKGLDSLLTILVKFFSILLTSDDVSDRVLLLYLVTSVLPTVLIWTIEGRRRGNRQTPITFLVTLPAVFALLAQIQGIAKIGPLYFLLSMWTGQNSMYQRTSGRPVDIATARAVLPAAFLGFVLPSVLMLLPFGDHVIRQNCIAFWQVSPILVSPLTSILAAGIRSVEGLKPDPRELEELTTRDVPHLLSAYSFSFLVAAAVHLATLAYILGTPGMSVMGVFGNISSPYALLDGWEPGVAVLNFIKYDLLIYSVASLVWCLYSILGLRQLGYVTTRHASSAALGVVASFFWLGPGAMYAGTWYWRETVIAGLSRWPKAR